jgi:tetratricopeptide (TPR) repeat protein
VELDAIRLAEELGDAKVKAFALAFLGWRMMMQGDHLGAAHALAESVHLGRVLRDEGLLAFALEGLGELHFVRDDYARARTAFEEAIPLARRANEDPSALARSQYQLARVALRQRYPDEAAGLVREGIRQFHREGNLDRVADCLSVAAGVAQARDECERGARWLGAVAAIRLDFGRQTVLKDWLYMEYDSRLAALHQAMALADFDRAFAVGERMTAAQAVDEVLAMG